ncbi:hypothetical protein SLS62_005402 [Diatrype stigma]|uniref:Uncharacterized protein n=1 Tax=Diatrype stigma TaxID=117547 RepID=A0AAN9V346_9PEZI
MAALPPDVWYKTANEWLDNPKDVFELARTCRMLWATLEKQVYTAEVRFFRSQDAAGQLRHVFFEESLHHAQAHGWSITPGRGGFPGQVRWAIGAQLEEHRQQVAVKLGQKRQYPSLYADAIEYFERQIADFPDPIPTRVPPASVLQWAAAEGVISTAKKVIGVAKVVWPAYVRLRHPHLLHQPIHLAVSNGHLEMVQFLVNHADASPMVTSGYVCLAPKTLHDAIKYVAPAIRLENSPGYEFNNVEKPFAIDALGLSILRGYEDMAAWLLARYDAARYTHSCEPSVDGTNGLCPSQEAPEAHRVDLKLPAICPLHLAALVGMDSIVQGLLEKGIRVDLPCQQSRSSTALMWACARQGNERIVDRLLSHGADLLTCDAARRTALMWALEHKLPDIAYRFVEAGVPVDQWAFSCGYVCAFSLSARDDRLLECTKLILQMYPDLRHVFLTRCFQQALRHNGTGANNETLRFFIDNNIGQGPVNVKDGAENIENWNITIEGTQSTLPVHVAAGHATVEITRLLLERYPESINERDGSGDSPLLLAAKAKKPNYERMALLLSYGADSETCLENIEESEYESEDESNTISPDASREARTMKKNRYWNHRRRQKRGMSSKEKLRQRISKAISGNFKDEDEDDPLWLPQFLPV